MDGLAQYGSDSSSDNEEPVVADDVTKSTDLTSTTTRDLTSTTIRGADTKISSSTDETSPSRKRRQRWDMKEQHQQQPDSSVQITLSDGPLPSPPLDSNASLIYWDRDYLHNRSSFDQPNEQLLSETQQQHLKEKLHQLNATFSTSSVAAASAAPEDLIAISTSTSSWAQHLKRQQEFHNPHFLNSVITHFGLDVLGSNMPTVVVEEFEYNVVRLEEEARYRQQQQLQFQPPPLLSNTNPKLYSSHSAASSSSSLLIQSDLERAMRGHI